MNDLLSRIAKEWERSTLVLLCLVAAVVGGLYVYDYLNPPEPEVERPKQRRPLPEYFAVSRLDGVSPAELDSDVNPMACEFRKPEPPPRPAIPWRKPAPQPQPQQPVQPQPAPQSAVQPVQPQQPAVQPQPTPQPVQPKPAQPKPKPKPPRVVELRYVGNMSIAGGTSSAQLYVSEVISKKQRNSFKTRLKADEKILGGLLVIKSFDKKGVVLTYGGGKTVKVPIGRGKATVVKIPQ